MKKNHLSENLVHFALKYPQGILIKKVPAQVANIGHNIFVMPANYKIKRSAWCPHIAKGKQAHIQTSFFTKNVPSSEHFCLFLVILTQCLFHQHLLYL
jgi:hypothetical protein